ncbi:MAG: FHA domain-containing protein [Gammaproteobacteria bacterium]
MAKFTVFFNDKPIQSSIFDSGVVHIGRDDTNDIRIDSLAIAPAQAAAVINDSGCTIKQLNDSFPIFVNQQKTKEQVLRDGDKITMGKHTIIYSATETVPPISSFVDKDLERLNLQIGANAEEPEANLQVMTGKHIGRIIPLKKSMTKLGHSGSGIAVISRRREGYFISALESAPSMKVNDSPVGDASIKLKNNDVVELNDISMLFFTD